MSKRQTNEIYSSEKYYSSRDAFRDGLTAEDYAAAIMEGQGIEPDNELRRTLVELTEQDYAAYRNE